MFTNSVRFIITWYHSSLLIFSVDKEYLLEFPSNAFKHFLSLFAESKDEESRNCQFSNYIEQSITYL